MGQIWMAYVTAFALGAGHALEVDHMVAVTTFVGGRPVLRRAVGFGLRWALGHSVVVLVVGGGLALAGVRAPASVQDWAELGVGVMLVALAVWAMRAGRLLHLHSPQDHEGHAHLHTHAAGSARHGHSHHGHTEAARHHRHLPTIIGALHGLAGTVPAVALIPVTLMPSKMAALAYLGTFGAGTILAMTTYSALAAVAAGRLATSSRLARAVAFATATASLLVGLWWIAAGVTTLRR